MQFPFLGPCICGCTGYGLGYFIHLWPFFCWHPAYRQVFMPVNLLCFPQVTLWISNRKNTKSPICLFITQRINTKWRSLLSCCTGKHAHYSASNKHLLRVNKSRVWLSLCGECPTIRGNHSLRKKKSNTLIFYSWLQKSRGGEPKIYRHRETQNKRFPLSHFKWHLLTPSPFEEMLIHVQKGFNIIAISVSWSDC